MTTTNLTGTGVGASADPREQSTPRQLFPKPNILRENIIGYLFISPAMLLIFIFGVFPIGYAVHMSLHRWGIAQGNFMCDSDTSNFISTIRGCLTHYEESAIGSWNGLFVAAIGFTILFFAYWFWVNVFDRKRRSVGAVIFWQIALLIMGLGLIAAGLNTDWNPAVLLIIGVVIGLGGFWFWTNLIDLKEINEADAQNSLLVQRVLAGITMGTGVILAGWAVFSLLSIVAGMLLLGQDFSLNTLVILGVGLLVLVGLYLLAAQDDDDLRDTEFTHNANRVFRVSLRAIGIVFMAQAIIGIGIPFSGWLFGDGIDWTQVIIGCTILIALLGAVGVAFNVFVLGDAFENGQGVVLRGFVFLLIIVFIAGMIGWGSMVIDTFARSFETFVAPVSWPALGLMFIGLGLLFVAYRFWTNAFEPGTRQAFARLMVSLAIVALSLAVISYGWNQMFGSLTRRNQDFLDGLEITVYFAFGSIPLQLLLGLLLAYILFQNIQGKEVYRMVFFLPYVTPAVASAVVFGRIFRGDNLGLVNTTLDSLGVPVQRWVQEPRPFLNVIFGWELEGFMAGPSMALISVIVLGIWTYVGYNAVIFLAGLGGIPNDLYEAAKVDGASQWHLFRFITLPLLSPITFYLSLLGFIGTFQAFNTLFVIRTPAAQKTLDTAGLVIYDTFNDIKRGEAAAQAIILFIVILILTQLQRNVFEKRVFYG